LDSARDFVTQTWEEFGADLTQAREETILIRDGYYCGRRFHCDGLVAVWFIEEKQVKFYDREGQISRVSALPEVTPAVEQPLRRAA
jgi:hypothetical protein